MKSLNIFNHEIYSKYHLEIDDYSYNSIEYANGMQLECLNINTFN
jgi:hypothetical protein